MNLKPKQKICARCGEKMFVVRAKYCYTCTDKLVSERRNERNKRLSLVKKASQVILIFIFAVMPMAIPNYAQANEQTRQELRSLSRKVRASDERKAKLAERNNKIQRVTRILADAHSPMVSSAESFILASERYGVSYKLLLALAWKESSLGRFTPKYNGVESYNAWGWGIHQNRSFDSWSDGVFTVAEGLSRNYRHEDIVATIYKYAPPTENNTALYISQVREFIKKI